MIFDVLSEKDKDLIYNYIRDFGPNPGSSVFRSYAGLDYLLRFWEQNKMEYLYRLMGEQFILEKKISYAIPTDKLSQQIGTACAKGPMASFIQHYKQKMECIFNKDGHRYWYSDEQTAFYALINYENLATNSIVHDIGPVILDFGDGNKLKIEKTSKPMRALGKIAKFIGEEEAFEEFRLEHSRILNQKKLEGILCLSIHPLDYLTMSDNESRWTSCMSWKDTGGYRMGTVEMMNSPCVVIGYLKSENSTWYNWNDKHWRSLFLVTPDIITSIKGYPYQAEELSRMCVDWLKELGAKNLSWDFNETTVIKESYTFKYVDENYYNLRTETAIMYNDFGTTTHYGALPNVIRESSTQEDPYTLTVYYSGPTECMCCGEKAPGLYDESYVFCDDCCTNADEYEDCECEHCGQYWSYDEMYDVDGDMICPDCVDDVAAESAIDGCYHYFADLVKVYASSMKDNPNIEEDDYCYLPIDCINKYDLLEDYDHLINLSHPRSNGKGIFYFNKEDITEMGLSRWFHIYSWNQTTYFRENE